MATRYIGDCLVCIEYHDQGDYRGTVSVPDSADGKYRLFWAFRDLHAPQIGGAANRHGYDSPEAYDEQAASAVSFGSYYTTHNRGDDVPDWAPPPEVADAIDSAASWAQNDSGEYAVRRSPNGPERFCS